MNATPEDQNKNKCNFPTQIVLPKPRRRDKAINVLHTRELRDEFRNKTEL